ncbi:MAG: hypothetical protein U0270_24940 [Labilithrix sp.]
MSKGWHALLWLVTALVVAPLCLPGWMPFCDLPEHAASMGSIAHWNDPSYGGPEHYQIGWTTSQYLLLHLVGGLVTRVTGSLDVTLRIVLVGLAVAWVQSLRFMLRSFGGDQRLAMLGALLFWNRALVLGFLPYLVSLPLLFATLGLFVGEERPTRRRSLALAGCGLAVFYTHASAFTLLGAIVVSIAVVRSGIRGAIRRVLWLAPAGLVAALWVLRGRFAMHGTNIHDASEIGTMNPLRAMKVMALWSHDIWSSHVDDVIGIAFWAAFLVLIAGQGKRVGSLVPLLVGVAVYLVTPFRVGTGFLLNVRMAPVLAAFALLAVRPRDGWLGRAPILAGAILALVQCVDNVAHVRHFQRDVDGVPELLAHVPRGGKLISLNFSGYDPNELHFPAWIYAGSYHRAYDGGVSSFSFSELPHWSVQYRPETAPPKQEAIAWAMAPCLYRNVRDGAYFDYMLVRGAVDPFRDSPLGPRWRVVGKTAKFVLYEKDLSREDVTEGTDDGVCRGLRPKV